MSHFEKIFSKFIKQEGMVFLPYLERVNPELRNIFETKKYRFGKLTEKQQKEILAIKKAFALRLSLGEARYLLFSQRENLPANPSAWKDNHNQYFSLIEELALKNNIPTPIFNGLIKAENEKYDTHAVRDDTKAIGLGQVMPETAEKDYKIDRSQLKVPKINLTISADYLRRMYKFYSSKVNKLLSEIDRWKLAIAAYNWGYKNIDKAISKAGYTFKNIPSFKCAEKYLPLETRLHIQKIMLFVTGFRSI